MSQTLSTAVGMVVLILLISFSIPYALDYSQNNQVETDKFQTAEESQLIEESVLVRVDDINTTASPNQVTLTVQDLQTLNTSSRTINATNKETYQMDGGNVSATPTSISTEDVTFRFEYPPTYGWDQSQKQLVTFLPVLLGGLAVIIVGSIITSAINKQI